MAGPGELGRAYISLHADDKALPGEVHKAALLMAAEAEKEAEVSGRGSSRGFTQAFEKETKRAAPRVAGTLYRSIQGDLFKVMRSGRLLPIAPLVKEAEQVAEVMGERMAMSLGGRIASGIAGGIKTALSGAGGAIGSVFNSISSLGPGGAKGGGVGGLYAAAIPALIGLVLSVSTAIFNLLHGVALLPGAAGVAVAAIVPMIFAFHGLGKAMAAAFGTDKKALAAEIKKLTPAAGSFIKELAKAHPVFVQIQKTAQQGFFSKIVGDLTRATKALGPIFNKGFGQVTGAAGSVVHQLFLLARDPAVQKFFKDLFAATSVIIRNFGPALKSVFRGLAMVGDATLPVIVQLMKDLSDWATKWGSDLSGAAKDGKVQGFIDKFLKGLSQLKELFDAGKNLIGALIGGEDEQNTANNTFDNIIGMINVLAEFFRSKLGQEGLKGMVILAELLFAALVDVAIVLGTIASVSTSIAESIDNAIGKALTLYDKLVGIAELGRVGQAVGIALAHAVGGNKPAKTGFGRKGHADGVISTQQHLAMISEGNRAEVVIPLTSPARARQLADQSGLSSMLNHGGDTVVVYIGDEQVAAKVVRWANGALKGFGRSMRYGPRTVGAGA